MDDESGKFIEGDEVPGERRSEPKIQRLARGCWREIGR